MATDESERERTPKSLEETLKILNAKQTPVKESHIETVAEAEEQEEEDLRGTERKEVPGFFQYMRESLFGGKEDEGVPEGGEEGVVRIEENEDPGQALAEARPEPAAKPREETLRTPEKKKRNLSVLDELQNFWEQQDACSAQSLKGRKGHGIMAIDRVEMDQMLCTTGKKPKRTSAFCIGV